MGLIMSLKITNIDFENKYTNEITSPLFFTFGTIQNWLSISYRKPSDPTINIRKIVNLRTFLSMCTSLQLIYTSSAFRK